MLPQTQCRQCGYDGCRPYAAAIHAGTVEIDRCPPGGVAGVARLSAVTGRPMVPLDATRGLHKPVALAVIDDAICIGCTLCIQACPVDAIAGGAKRMHDVIPELCTGCELCVAPCPVDCIRMEPAGFEWTDALAAAARGRHEARAVRLARTAHDDDQRRARRDLPAGPSVEASPQASTDGDPAAARRRAIIAAAVARAGARAAAGALPHATPLRPVAPLDDAAR